MKKAQSLMIEKDLEKVHIKQNIFTGSDKYELEKFSWEHTD